MPNQLPVCRSSANLFETETISFFYLTIAILTVNVMLAIYPVGRGRIAAKEMPRYIRAVRKVNGLLHEHIGFQV